MWSKGCWMKSLPCRILCMLPLKKKDVLNAASLSAPHPVPRISHGAGWNLITFDCMVPLSFHSVLSPWLQIANKKPSIQRCLWIKWAVVVVVVVVRNEKSSNELQNEARPRGWWLMSQLPPKWYLQNLFKWRFSGTTLHSITWPLGLKRSLRMVRLAGFCQARLRWPWSTPTTSWSHWRHQISVT